MDFTKVWEGAAPYLGPTAVIVPAVIGSFALYKAVSLVANAWEQRQDMSFKSQTADLEMKKADHSVKLEILTIENKHKQEVQNFELKNKQDHLVDVREHRQSSINWTRKTNVLFLMAGVAGTVAIIWKAIAASLAVTFVVGAVSGLWLGVGVAAVLNLAAYRQTCMHDGSSKSNI